MPSFSSRLGQFVCGATALLAAVTSASAQATFTPNGNSGFSGNLGLGQGLTVSNDGLGGINFSVDLSGGNKGFDGNDVVIYVDNGTGGGFSSTATFNDTGAPDGDGGRQATSGLSHADPANRSVLNFGGVLAPQYGIDLGQYYGQVFRLGTPLIQTDGTAPGSTGANGITYHISADGNVANIDVPASDLGLNPALGGTLQLFATYISEDGYRSNEAIGTFESGSSTSQGYGVDQTVATDFSFGVVPEPSTWITGAACLVVAARCFSIPLFRLRSPGRPGC